MKVDKEAFRELASMMSTAMSYPTGSATVAEFEVRFAPQAEVPRHVTVRVIEEFRGGEDDSVTDSLDMELGGGGDPQCRIRATFMGDIPKISRFLKDVRAPDSKIQLTKKCRMRPAVLLQEYSMRFNLKTEEDLTIKVIKEQADTNGIDSDIKSFRLKRRFSFMLSPQFRLDVTAVRFKEGHSTTYEELLQIKEVYEFEIEFIPGGGAEKKIPGGGAKVDDATTADSLTKEMLRHFNVLLKIIDDSEVVLSNSEKEATLNLYYDLVRTRVFVGPKPVTLEIGNLLLDPPHEMISITSPNHVYTVTEKADGERRLLVVDGDGFLYTLDDRMSVRALSRGIATKNLRHCILDGEYVASKRIFAIFDVFVVGRKDIRSSPLMGTKQDERGRVDWAHVVVADLQNNDDKRIRVKTFYAPSSGSSLLEHAKTILNRRDAKLFPYEIDGLIFTPRDLGVGQSWVEKKDDAQPPAPALATTWPEVFKWKPPEQSTIDFCVRFHGKEEMFRSNASSPGSTFLVAELQVGFNVHELGLRTFLKELSSPASEKQRKKNSEKKYELRPFAFREPDAASQALHLAYLPSPSASSSAPSESVCANGDTIADGSVVEFSYAGDPSSHSPYNWKPMRVRFDKIEKQMMDNRTKITANNYNVAMNVWRTISYPVTEGIITGNQELDDEKIRTDLLSTMYYTKIVRTNEGKTIAMRKFHNLVKGYLITQFMPRTGAGRSIFDFGVGKAGDLHKWIEVGASRVVGIDKFESNLTEPSNGAYARILQVKREKGRNQVLPDIALFQFDAAESLSSEEALDRIEPPETRYAVKVFLGRIKPNGPPMKEYFNMAKLGTFDLASCMFALHYFFETEERLRGLCRNVASVLKPGGFFIGICPDGEMVERLLDEKAMGYVEGVDAKTDLVLWRIDKKYGNGSAPLSPFGKRIDVYMETIGQSIPEYLVDYKVLVKMMGEEGMVPAPGASISDANLGSMSTGMLDKVYDKVVNGEIAKGAAESIRVLLKETMTDAEKEYSFINRWFVFQKK